MPTTFPCPNAQCSYQFDTELLPPAAMVTCPLCRTRFPYRANRPTAPTPGPDLGDEVRRTSQRLVHVRDVPRSGGVLVTLAWVGGFAVVLAGVIAVVVLRGRTHTDTSPNLTSERYNLVVEPFPAGWEDDLAVRRPFDANILGRKRAGPEAWVAISARDWGDRPPRTGELSEFLHGPVRNALSTPFFQPIDGAQWAGQPALAVQFAGNLDESQVRGEAYAFAYKGIGYVFYAWTADADWDSHRAELVELRDRIRLAGFREQWVERQTNVVIHTPDDAAGYQVEDPDGVWVRGKPSEEWDRKDKVKYPVDDLKSLDPAATMALLARYQPRERGDALRRQVDALALVVELPRAEDPLEAVQNHVIERIKRDYAGDAPPNLKLEPLEKSPSGITLPTNGPSMARYRFQDPLDRENRVMWIVSAMLIGDKTVAVETHVPEKDASFVEEWMVHLAGSLKVK